jgi:hypothetical protein
VAFSDTMQVPVALGDTTLTALLDSGSNHNFISEAAAHRSELPLQRRPRLTATVANSEQVVCLGVIREATLSIGSDMFFADLFVMPLAGYDVVLGTQWLATLGPIVWDFSMRTLTFRRHTREVCWHGLAGRQPPTSARPQWALSPTSSLSPPGCPHLEAVTTASP